MSQIQDKIRPQFSVIIPLYNKATHIKRAIDSVLAQTIQNFEIIVVGGRSTDGGEDIVQSYTDMRISFIQETGKGVSLARNQGVLHARADLIAFLDADDEWFPDYLQKILYLYHNYPSAGIYATGKINYYSENKQKREHVYMINDDWEGRLDMVFKCAAIDGRFPANTSSIVVPKDIFQQMKGFVPNIQFGEDIDLWARICLHYSFVYSAEPHMIYHIDSENKLTKDISTITTLIPPFLNSIKSYSDEWLKHNTDYYNLNLYMASLRLSIIKRKIAIGDVKEARKCLKEIKYKEFYLKKTVLYIISLLPQFIISHAVKLYIDKKYLFM